MRLNINGSEKTKPIKANKYFRFASNQLTDRWCVFDQTKITQNKSDRGNIFDNRTKRMKTIDQWLKEKIELF